MPDSFAIKSMKAYRDIKHPSIGLVASLAIPNAGKAIEREANERCDVLQAYIHIVSRDLIEGR